MQLDLGENGFPGLVLGLARVLLRLLLFLLKADHGLDLLVVLRLKLARFLLQSLEFNFELVALLLHQFAR